MRDLVIHAPTGLLLDFVKEDFGGSDQAAYIADWHLRRRAGRSPLVVEGELVCHRHRNHERPWLYLREHHGLLIAAHWSGTALADSHEIHHGVSDEHKRQVEYIHDAGKAAGFDVRTEVKLPTNVRPDAVIYGPRQIGIEVQRSRLTPAAAKGRTTKAHRAGVESLWFSDRPSNPPSWFEMVPSVAMMEFAWDTLPKARSVTVTSVKRIVSRRCQEIYNGQCPERRYGCNRQHPTHEPRREVLVDDVAEWAPRGVLVPMVFRPFKGGEQVLIVASGDKSLYEAMVGHSADLAFPQQERPAVQQAERIDCTADAGAVTQALLLEVDAERSEPRRLNSIGRLYAALDVGDPRRYAL
jgi:hypothetical protein